MPESAPTVPLPVRSPGRRERKALATRRALFDAGLEAFGRRPIGFVSVLDLTEAADVAKGVFYLYFKNKDDFLVQLYAEVQQQALEEMRAAAADLRAQSARAHAMARQFLRTAIARPDATRFLTRMLAYFPDEIGQPGQLSRVRADYLTELAALLGGVRAATLKPRHLRLAGVFEACCGGLVRQAAQTGAAMPDEAAFVRITGAALNCAPGAATRGPAAR